MGHRWLTFSDRVGGERRETTSMTARAVGHWDKTGGFHELPETLTDLTGMSRPDCPSSRIVAPSIRQETPYRARAGLMRADAEPLRAERHALAGHISDVIRAGWHRATAAQCELDAALRRKP